jgi:hypothetical protein
MRNVEAKPTQAADWGFATKKELELVIVLKLLEISMLPASPPEY